MATRSKCASLGRKNVLNSWCHPTCTYGWFVERLWLSTYTRFSKIVPDCSIGVGAPSEREHCPAESDAASVLVDVDDACLLSVVVRQAVGMVDLLMTAVSICYKCCEECCHSESAMWMLWMVEMAVILSSRLVLPYKETMD